MKILMRGKRIHLTEEVKESIHRRIYFSVGRFATWIRDIKIMLTDMNGPRGGVDKSCQVNIRLKPYGEVYMEDQSEDLQTVIYQIFDRLNRALDRKIKREFHQKPTSDFGGNGRVV
ncbi:MAG: HPF/RaiA family ribosome-associated protein [Deltaproteobacteria bacterium]|nr:MAG: HPF/RaiA family ribosome-associated protein [Deltaproteobacteria bacterium]